LHFEGQHFFPVLEFEFAHVQAVFDEFVQFDVLDGGQDGVDFEDLFDEELAVDENFVDLLVDGAVLDFAAEVGEVFEVVHLVPVDEFVDFFEDVGEWADEGFDEVGVVL
jgi:hypothetical protein